MNAGEVAASSGAAVAASHGSPYKLADYSHTKEYTSSWDPPAGASRGLQRAAGLGGSDLADGDFDSEVLLSDRLKQVHLMQLTKEQAPSGGSVVGMSSMADVDFDAEVNVADDGTWLEAK